MKRFCFLIDDDPDEWDFFQRALKEIPLDLELTYLSDPVEALEFLKEGHIKPDYIFLDINMPKLNGWECLRQLDNLKSLCDVSVAMYSTTVPEELPVELNNLFKVTLIPKSPTILNLILKLKEFFQVK